MEESGELHSVDDKGLSERSKRRFKTPQQLAVLEEFYNEHKYPTDEMRFQLAEQLGLTEKQISGWFCHRRLKDKRLLRDESNADGRQDRSSGVNQDHASGLRQDSCGSSKQEDRRVDPREVESRRLYWPNSCSADLAFEHKGQYTGSFAAPEDTSSESSSASRDRFCAQVAEHFGKGRFVGKNEVFNPHPSNGKSAMDVRYNPSGYLKRKGEVENFVITAVKRQLGRHFQDDGPLLGIEFDPVPPGAFESPMNEPNFGSHYAEDPTPTSPHSYGVQKPHNLNSRLAAYNSKIDCHRSYEAEGNFPGDHSFPYYDHQTHNQLNRKYVASNFAGEYGGRNSADMQEYHNGDAYVHNFGRESRSTITRHPLEEMRQAFASDCLPPRSLKSSSRKKDRYLHDYGSINNGFAQNEKVMLEPVTNRRSESLHPEEEGPSRKILKKENRRRDTELSEYLDHDREKLHRTQQIPAATMVRAKLPQRDGTSFFLPARKYQTSVLHARDDRNLKSGATFTSKLTGMTLFAIQMCSRSVILRGRRRRGINLFGGVGMNDRWCNVLEISLFILSSYFYFSFFLLFL